MGRGIQHLVFKFNLLMPGVTVKGDRNSPICNAEFFSQMLSPNTKIGSVPSLASVKARMKASTVCRGGLVFLRNRASLAGSAFNLMSLVHAIKGVHRHLSSSPSQPTCQRIR
jgi:hypothetical protein